LLMIVEFMINEMSHNKKYIVINLLKTTYILEIIYASFFLGGLKFNPPKKKERLGNYLSSKSPSFC
jgi:hypothetical protein